MDNLKINFEDESFIEYSIKPSVFYGLCDSETVKDVLFINGIERGFEELTMHEISCLFTNEDVCDAISKELGIKFYYEKEVFNDGKICKVFVTQDESRFCIEGGDITLALGDFEGFKDGQNIDRARFDSLTSGLKSEADIRVFSSNLFESVNNITVVS